MYAKSYKDLIVWQKSIQLVKAVYAITEQFPKSEIYALASQMRRAAVSIPSNIAEGYKRKGRLEFLQFLSIAEGFAAELETQVIKAVLTPGQAPDLRNQASLVLRAAEPRGSNTLIFRLRSDAMQTKTFARRSSLAEIIAKDLYPTVKYEPAEQLLEEVQKILAVFIRKLNAKR